MTDEPHGFDEAELAADYFRACLAGQRVPFATATEWVARLSDAQRQGRLAEELRKLERIPLLVVEATSPSTRAPPTSYSRSSAPATSAPP
jgi:IstB-like ATP binding protein